MVNDTISDMLTRIRNANMVKHQIVQVPMTKMSLSISKILKEEGYIEDFESYTENNKNYLLISLKYMGKSRKSVICKTLFFFKNSFHFHILPLAFGGQARGLWGITGNVSL